jgi:hypothetical protein
MVGNEHCDSFSPHGEDDLLNIVYGERIDAAKRLVEK